MSDLTDSQTALTTNVTVDKLSLEKHDHYHEQIIDVQAVEILYAINPQYAERYLALIENAMNLEAQESARDNETLNKALDNDRAVIDLNSKKILRAQSFAFWLVIFLSSTALLLAFNGFEKLAGLVFGSVIIMALKYFLGSRKDQNKPSENDQNP